MKVEVEIHPLGSERFFCDMDLDILRVTISRITIHMDVRDPDEMKIQHQMDLVAVEESLHGMEVFGTRRVMWQNEPFEHIFLTIEEAKARRDDLRKLRRG